MEINENNPSIDDLALKHGDFPQFYVYIYMIICQFTPGPGGEFLLSQTTPPWPRRRGTPSSLQKHRPGDHRVPNRFFLELIAGKYYFFGKNIFVWNNYWVSVGKNKGNR